VENAAIALTDGVDLMLTPGRMCQNGQPAPLRDPAFQKFAQRDASRRTHRFASRPHKESGESVGCDERPRRRLFRLSSGLSPGSCRESLQVHPRADEVNTGFCGASRWRRRSSGSFNSRHIASVINQVRVKCTSRRMGYRTPCWRNVKRGHNRHSSIKTASLPPSLRSTISVAVIVAAHK
jgi:hypothetical protein